MAVGWPEKFTLSPVLRLNERHKRQGDPNATAGLVEYNLGGTGTQIGGQFNYSQRGPKWMSGSQNRRTDRTAGRKR